MGSDLTVSGSLTPFGTLLFTLKVINRSIKEKVRPLDSSLTLSVVVAVPGEVGGVGAEGGLGRE